MKTYHLKNLFRHQKCIIFRGNSTLNYPFFFFFFSKNGIWNIAEFFGRLDIYKLGILSCLGLNWKICLSCLFKTFRFPIHICALCFWHLIVNMGKQTQDFVSRRYFISFLFFEPVASDCYQHLLWIAWSLVSQVWLWFRITEEAVQIPSCSDSILWLWVHA